MMNPLLAVAIAAGAMSSIACASGPVLTERGLVYPENAETPRYLTDAERRFIELNPIVNMRGTTAPPTGPIHCVAEYEPMDGIVVGWEGSTSWNNILAQLGGRVTTTVVALMPVVVHSGLPPIVLHHQDLISPLRETTTHVPSTRQRVAWSLTEP